MSTISAVTFHEGKHQKPQLRATVMELFILVKGCTTVPSNNDTHPQLQPAERAKGTQHTGRRGFQPGREETKDRTPPTCHQHPAGYAPIKVSTGKTQCLWIPVPSLKEQPAGAQVTVCPLSHSSSCSHSSHPLCLALSSYSLRHHSASYNNLPSSRLLPGKAGCSYPGGRKLLSCSCIVPQFWKATHHGK